MFVNYLTQFVNYFAIIVKKYGSKRIFFSIQLKIIITIISGEQYENNTYPIN